MSAFQTGEQININNHYVITTLKRERNNQWMSLNIPRLALPLE